ncbi:unnamed protein product [Nesidiocoris tenuis]|uniref:Uncharacterized protein n=1 Tax=Nesidiocoris tenuis TaxID=355587 RepID=A0A6H5HK94_9HEMI|nr:unnamed protein product [Nesidiocoris tenuis]
MFSHGKKIFTKKRLIPDFFGSRWWPAFQLQRYRLQRMYFRGEPYDPTPYHSPYGNLRADARRRRSPEPTGVPGAQRLPGSHGSQPRTRHPGHVQTEIARRHRHQRHRPRHCAVSSGEAAKVGPASI